MTLVKFVMFVVLKILDNFVSMQNSLNVHNCFFSAFWHGKETFPKSSSSNEIFRVYSLSLTIQ